MTRGQIAEGLATICGLVGVVTLAASAVASAIAYAKAGDFADLLHLALAGEAGAESFATFDRKFPRSDEAGPAVEIV